MCPFSILAFLQPTTVDKEPILVPLYHSFEKYSSSLSHRAFQQSDKPDKNHKE